MMADAETKSLPLPPGELRCVVYAVDTTCYLTVPADTLVEPVIKGHGLMNFPTISFLIINEAMDRKVLFDLGCKRDFWNLPLPIASIIDTKVPGIKVDRDLSDVLVEGGIDLNTLEAAIISHHHYDHVGDPMTFPAHMKLVVGPGFTQEFMPGYPEVETAPFFSQALRGRAVEEINFSETNLSIAGFSAVDYFGDGSLYILSTPGHAVGHLSALVRTGHDAFLFLGGDICHFGGSFRPTNRVPLPEQLDAVLVASATTLHHGGHTTTEYIPRQSYQWQELTTFHPCGPTIKAKTTPFYRPCSRGDSWYVDPASAERSIRCLQDLDADERVLVIIAHDPSTIDILTFFPDGILNDWKKAGWKAKLRWRFLGELPIAGIHRKYLVDGTYVNGKRVKNLTGAEVAE